MNAFTTQIVQLIKQIPPGKVCTYGTLAALAGNPRGARQVSWTLRTQTEKEQLPWHRVVGGQGKISIIDSDGYQLQKGLLSQEGILFDDHDRIDLKKQGWLPTSH